jgi:hypothetical protein
MNTNKIKKSLEKIINYAYALEHEISFDQEKKIEKTHYKIINEAAKIREIINENR